MKLEGQNILILSNEPWGDIWYSKHNYANELSKKNKVYFLNPPNAFSPSKFFSSQIKEVKVSDNLTVLEYSNALPVSLLNFWKWNDKIIFRRLKKYFATKKINDLIFWTFDPIRLGFPEILVPKKIILHAMDDYKFSFESEKLLATKAHHIFCVSPEILEAYKKFNPNINVIPHAIPDDEFLPISSKKENPLTGVFIGKIDARIDLDFNMEIFRSFPEVHFKVIGIVNDEFLQRLKKENLNNVILIPPIRSEEIKNYVRDADFCFIFKKSYVGNNISSHKLLQYLAQGKPIFGTDFSDMSTELKKALYLSNDILEIKNKLTAFIQNGESADKIEIRINYCQPRTFSKTISRIENILEQTPTSAYLYYSKISFKTKLLNVFRGAFTNSFLDGILSKIMRRSPSLRPFLMKLVPPEYLYKKTSWRSYEWNGVKMKLNISNLVDHCVYFSAEQKALDHFIHYLKASDTIIDVGANIGYTTLLFSKAVSKGKVLSIEPSKELFNTVKEQLDLNQINNTTCLNIGLGEKELMAQLYKVSENNSGMNRVFEHSETTFESESIHIKTLDNVVKEQKIGIVNAIKIDVEGYEFKILKGAYDTIKTHKPVLLIEIDDLNLREQQSNPAEVLQFLEGLNYSIKEASDLKAIDMKKDLSGVHFDIICFPKTD
jgi:FkbM family methyltransferase